MIRNKSILAIVPARGGSKGIPKKNIRLLAGKPLIQHTIEVINACDWIDVALISTDDEEIARICSDLDMSVPFLRPVELSHDLVSDMPVLKHALIFEESRLNRQFDIVLMLQPTCPLRHPTEVLDCLLLLLDGNFDATWTVSETDLKFHPDKQLRVSSGGEISFFTENAIQVIARQQLTSTYHRNGNTYAFTRDSILNSKSTLSGRTGALILKTPQINIDNLEDFYSAEIAIKNLGL
jgi:CMP-N-acetylneuraminic acid synthetase